MMDTCSNIDKPFTVIICTYNGALRLYDVVSRITGQASYDKLIESVLIVDNNSSDNTREVAFKLVELKPNIRYLYEPAQGLSAARANGVRQTLTEWIIFLDDDNYIQPDWIEKCYNYIQDHAEVGAFNGCIVPSFSFQPTPTQEALMKIIYKGLACTTHSESAGSCADCEQWMPVGAGLVIRAQPLREYVASGWTVSTGRVGSNTASGEDTDMVKYVMRSGYKPGFCDRMMMYHRIDSKRLEEGYVLRLFGSFADYKYVCDSNSRHYISIRAAQFLISLAKLSAWNILPLIRPNNIHIQLKSKISIAWHARYINRCLGDKLILRNHAV